MEKSESKKRVMHITFNMDVGGTEQVIRQLISGLDSTVFDCRIICIDGSIGQMGQEMLDEGIQIQSVSRRAGFDWAVIASLRRLIKQSEIDVLHCHQYTPFCYGALASVGTGVKVVFTEHGRFHPDRFTWKRRIVNQILLRLVDRTTCISKATRRALAQYEWIPESHVEVIYNGLEMPVQKQPCGSVRKNLGIREDTFLLGTIARLDSIKNQNMMIAGLAEFRSVVPNSMLIIAGNGPAREQLEQCAKTYGVSDAVLFTGYVSEIADYLCAFDVFLLTSFSEGTSMTLLEAMAIGKPIIATAVGGNKEVIENGRDGILIPSDDCEALVRELVKLQQNSMLQNSLSHQAKASFNARFNTQKMCDAYSRVYG